MDLMGTAARKPGVSTPLDTTRLVNDPPSRRLERPGGTDPSGEPVVEVVNSASLTQALKVVGPGRKERTYQDRIHALEQESSVNEHALETAALIERGSRNLLDRMERQLDSSDEALDRERAASRRVCVMLGSLQRENEVIREELKAARAQLARLEAPKSKRLWRRLLGRG